MSALTRKQLEAIEAEAEILSEKNPIDWVQPFLKTWRGPFRWGEEIRPGWRLIDDGPNAVGVASADGLRVILSGRIEADGKRWLHVSYSRARAVPSYEDTLRVRRLFLGEDRYCYAIWPPKDLYVNIHPNCLHLWCCLDGPVMPEFSVIVGGVRAV